MAEKSLGMCITGQKSISPAPLWTELATPKGTLAPPGFLPPETHWVKVGRDKSEKAGPAGVLTMPVNLPYVMKESGDLLRNSKCSLHMQIGYFCSVSFVCMFIGSSIHSYNSFSHLCPAFKPPPSFKAHSNSAYVRKPSCPSRHCSFNYASHFLRHSLLCQSFFFFF